MAFRFCLAGVFPSDVNRIGGGVEHVGYLLSQTMSVLSGIELHVVGLVSQGMDYNEFEDKGVNYHLRKVSGGGFPPKLLTEGNFLEPIFKKIQPDVINSHDVRTTDGAIRSGFTTIHMIHGIKRRESKYFYGREKLAALLHGYLEARVILQCNAVMSVAQYGLDEYAKFIKCPSAVIPVPIEDQFYSVPPIDNPKGILYAGGISPRKNLLSLVKAMSGVISIYPDAVLYVCGGASDASYCSVVKSYVADHGLSNNVEFLGVVDRQRLTQCLADSVTLVLPSRQETSPGVIAQAMAAGRPAIASPVGGVPELIEDCEDGFIVDPDETDLLAERIIRLLSNPDKAREMGEKARASAIDRHDRKKVADRIVKLCKSLVETGNFDGAGEV